MNFRQFAYNNARRNAGAYSAYFLSSSFAVMIFFTYAVFIFHPDIATVPMGGVAKDGMKAAEYIIFVFSFLFVLYSISAFLKVRQKEFGILSILGASNGQIHRLIFLENIMIGAASILVGITFGLVFSKLFLLIGAKAMGIKPFPMYLPWKAIGITGSAFAGLFLFVSLVTVFLIRQNNVLSLLQGSKKPKPEPKASVFLSLLTILLIIATIYMVNTVELDLAPMICIIVLGSVATYFLYTQLSVFVIHLLKKKRAFFWRGTHMLWVSEMAYKMKDNARMFFMVTIITTVACVAVGAVLSLSETNKQVFMKNPIPISYTAIPGEKWQTDIQWIDNELKQAGVAFEKVKFVSSDIDFQEISTDPQKQVIKQSDFNQLGKVFNFKPITPLQPGQAFFIESEVVREEQKTERLHQLTPEQGKTSLQVVGQMTVGMKRMIVVSDDTYQQLTSYAEDGSKDQTEIVYHIPAWSNNTLPDDNSPEIQISQKLTNWVEKKQETGTVHGFLTIRGEDYNQLEKGSALIMFIGLFVAAIFSICMASFLYFKLYTDLNQDRQIYNSLSKIGLSPGEMKKAATIQLAILFFLPLVFAGVDTWVILQSLTQNLGMDSILLPVTMTIGGFFAAQLIYFLVVRSRYLGQLDKVMV